MVALGTLWAWMTSWSSVMLWTSLWNLWIVECRVARRGIGGSRSHAAASQRERNQHANWPDHAVPKGT